MTPNGKDAEALAKARFIVLTMVRFTNLACVLMGVAFISGKLLEGPEFLTAGAILVVIGAAGFFGVPVLLKKLWAKSTP